MFLKVRYLIFSLVLLSCGCSEKSPNTTSNFNISKVNTPLGTNTYQPHVNSNSDTIFYSNQSFKGHSFKIVETGETEYHEHTIRVYIDSLLIVNRVLESEMLEEIFMRDLDQNGIPEVYLHTRGGGSGGFSRLEAVDANGNTIDMDQLEQHARDDFDFSNEFVIQSYTIYMPNDANCCPSGSDTIIFYHLKDTLLLKTVNEHFPTKPKIH